MKEIIDLVDKDISKYGVRGDVSPFVVSEN
jgi:hypothetical protein